MKRKYNFEPVTLREEVSPRGGGVEIDLTDFGFPNERMSAYQNYLGGGMLGRVCSNNTINAYDKKISVAKQKKLDRIETELKMYFFELTNPDTEWEHQTFDKNQFMPVSAY